MSPPPPPSPRPGRPFSAGTGKRNPDGPLPSIVDAIRRAMLAVVILTLLLSTAWTITNAWIAASYIGQGWAVATYRDAQNNLERLARETELLAEIQSQVHAPALANRRILRVPRARVGAAGTQTVSGFARLDRQLVYFHAPAGRAWALTRPLNAALLERLRRTTGAEWVLLEGQRPVLSTLKNSQGTMLLPDLGTLLARTEASMTPDGAPIIQDQVRLDAYAGFLGSDGKLYGREAGPLDVYASPLPLPGPDGRAVGLLVSLVPRDVVFAGVSKAAAGAVIVLLLLLLAAFYYARRVANRYLEPLHHEVARLRLLDADSVPGPAAGQDATSELETLRQAVSQVEAGIRSERALAAQVEQERARSAFSSKMASLGEMASGVAHEINTPLAVIVSRAEQMAELLDEPQPDRAALKSMAQRIVGTAQRIAAIVKGLRNFARDGSQEPLRSVSLRELTDEVLAFCQERFRLHGVALQLDASLDGALLRCRPTEAMQVLLNLLNNAFDAVQDRPGAWVRLEAQRDGGQVRIRVSDSGAGIEAALAQKLFQPFFTTKEPGKGTGLGLSISRSITEAQGGTLELDAAHPHTSFVLTLPAALAGAAAA